MRRVFLTLILLLPLCISAQQTIGDILVDEKHSTDSLMRLQYGEELFNGYFDLNPASGGRTNYEFQNWNDTTADSVRYYFIWYYFRFPGAKVDSALSYEYYGDKNQPPSRGSYDQIYSGQCILMDSTQMNTVTITELHKQLSECTIRLYEYSGFNDSLYFALDSTHVYLEVEHDSVRYYGWKNRKVHLIRNSIIIDACNNIIVSRNTLDWKGLAYRESTIPNEPCVR